jgi:hypothetical protein
MKKIWKWLKGKKRAIGLVLFAASKYAGEYGGILEIAAFIVGGVGIGDAINEGRKKKRG